MTVPVSLPVVAAPALPDSPTTTPGTTDTTGDAFAAVLAALSGALGVPVQQLTVQVADATSPTADATSADDAACGVTAVPGAWTAATQRQAVPGIAPTVAGEDAPVDAVAAPPDEATTPVALPLPGTAAKATAAEPGPVGPAHATHGTEVRATRPAGEHAPFARLAQQTVAPTSPTVDVEAPVVPVVVEDPAPVAAAPDVAAATQVAPTTAPAAPAAPAAQPAVLEAARGLRHEGGGRTSLVVRLDPPELGAVLVRLTVQDGRVDVQLRTPDLVARNDLQAQQRDVQQVLRDQGFDLSSFDVTHGDVLPGNKGDSPDRGPPQRSRRADGAMDDHHSVMDDGPAPEPSGTWL